MSKYYRVSLDLDGVVAKTERWPFRVFNTMRLMGKGLDDIEKAEIEYYSTRPLLHHPSEYLHSGDTGFIITSRKPIAYDATLRWTERHGIDLPVLFSDLNGEINWDGDYGVASKQAAEKKAELILSLSMNVHIDNNPYIVKWLRLKCPEVAIIQVGGERVES